MYICLHFEILYIYAVKCECSLSNESVRTICIGPSIPPCDCNQATCEVNSVIHMYIRIITNFMLVMCYIV